MTTISTQVPRCIPNHEPNTVPTTTEITATRTASLSELAVPAQVLVQISIAFVSVPIIEKCLKLSILSASSHGL